MSRTWGINGGTLFEVDDRGWLLKCVAAIRAGEACAVRMDAGDMVAVIKAVREQAEKVAGGVAGAIGAALDPSALVGMLAAAGSVGGAVGAVAVCSAMAHARSMIVSPCLVIPPHSLDPKDVAFHVEFTPEKKS